MDNTFSSRSAVRRPESDQHGAAERRGRHRLQGHGGGCSPVSLPGHVPGRVAQLPRQGERAEAAAADGAVQAEQVPHASGGRRGVEAGDPRSARTDHGEQSFVVCERRKREGEREGERESLVSS